MSNNKQSSVEWLLDNLHLQHSTKWTEIVEQAKAMHKEEICTAFRIGENFAVDYYMESELDKDEQYYYETFNNESTN